MPFRHQRDTVAADDPAEPELPLRTRRRDPDARPLQILDAAFHEFGARGLEATTLDAIARRAGVAKGTIYLYFPTKEALFREMVRATIGAALEEAEARLATGDARSAVQQLRLVAAGWWTVLRTPRFAIVQQLVSAAIHHAPDLLQFYAEEVIARGRRLAASVITRGIAQGEFRPVDPEVAARMLSALAVTHAGWCERRQLFATLQGRTDEQVFDEYFAFYLQAMRPDAPAAPDARPASSPAPLP